MIELNRTRPRGGAHPARRCRRIGVGRLVPGRHPVPAGRGELDAAEDLRHLHLPVRRESRSVPVEFLEPAVGPGTLPLRQRRVVRPGLQVGDFEGRLRQEVRSDHHVLRGRRHRPPVRGQQHVVAGEHEHPGLQLSLEGQGQVNGHLVSVEVRVEGGAHQGVDADRLALDQNRFEGLNPDPVQRRRPVEEHRVIADDVLEHLVHLWVVLLDDLLGPLDRLRFAPLLQLVDDEGLEQLDGHRLGQAALVQLQLGTHDDHRAARVVHPLSEKVLAETSLLPLQHVGQRLQRPLAPAADRLGAPAVVEEGVDRLLQHPFLVPEDDLGRPHVDQLLETVVAIDDAAVEIVEVGGGEPSSVEGDEGPQVGRDDGDRVQHHPLGPVPPVRRVTGVAKGVDDLETAQLLLLPVLRGLRPDLLAQPSGKALQPAAVAVVFGDRNVRGVQPPQQRPDRFRADLGHELVVALLAGLHAKIVVLVLVQQLQELHVLLARPRDRVRRVVDDLLQVLERHPQEVAQLARQGLEEPDVAYGNGQIDVAHPFAADLRERDLHPAAIADDAAKADALVLAAGALPVLDRTEGALAEESVRLRLERPVVDRLGLGHFAVRPLANVFRRRDPHPDEVEVHQAGFLRSGGKVDHVQQSVASSPWMKPPEHRERRGAGPARRDRTGIAALFARGATRSEALRGETVYYTLHNGKYSLHREEPRRSGPDRMHRRSNAGGIFVCGLHATVSLASRPVAGRGLPCRLLTPPGRDPPPDPGPGAPSRAH